jgi:hypothetical protein
MLASGQRQERVAMTAELPTGRAAEEVRSLEVRWIFTGPLETAVIRWFGRFPIETESREDSYLLEPRLPGLSVKVRGGRPLEVKMYHGSPGILEVAGRARGHLESWQKWSFPVNPPAQYDGSPAGWRAVRKRRRISRFALAGGQILARASELDHEPQCDVELTEVSTIGQDWWTLGFEASGPDELLRTTLEATAGLVFDRSMPGGAVPGLDESKSYQQWLSQRPDASPEAW